MYYTNGRYSNSLSLIHLVLYSLMLNAWEVKRPIDATRIILSLRNIYIAWISVVGLPYLYIPPHYKDISSPLASFIHKINTVCHYECENAAEAAIGIIMTCLDGTKHHLSMSIKHKIIKKKCTIQPTASRGVRYFFHTSVGLVNS